MPTLREIWSTRTIGKDATGKKTAVRVFQADFTNTAGVESEFESNAIYRQFPGDASLTFDSYSIEINGTGAGFTLRANFSNFKAGRFATVPPRDSPVYYHWGWSDREVPAEVLSAVREWRTVTRNVAGVDTEEMFQVWVGRKVKIYEVRPQRIFKRRVTGVSVEDFDAIATQRNRIHVLSGAKWQFVGGNVRETDGTSFDVTYTWEQDKGTMEPTPFVDPAIPSRWVFCPFLRPPGVQVPTGMFRLPYEQIGVVIPPADPRTSIPLPTGMFPYTEDPTGWRSLPGTDVLQ